MRTFAPVSGPELGAGVAETLTRSGDLPGTETYDSSGGVTVVNGAAYVIDRNRIARVNLTTGEVTTAAGSATDQACRDSATGTDVRLTNTQELRMAGTDGAYVYATGPCGLHRIDPETGATNTFIGGYTHATVAGHYLFGVTTWNELFQHDLRDLANRRRLGSGYPSTAIAGDADSVWYLQGNLFHRINIATGEDTTIPSTLPGQIQRLQSVGAYLYANMRMHHPGDPVSTNQLVRIAKSDGKVQHIDGGDVGQDGFNFTKITGIAADGRKLYIVDSQSAATHLKAITPTDVRTFAPPAAGPELEAAVVSTVGQIAVQPTLYLSLHTGGIAMLGKSVVTIDGRRVVRVDPASGAVTPIAGDQSATGCTNSSTGSAVRFGSHHLRMMGTDGVYIYIADLECGPRRIDSTTGATTYIATERYDYGTVAGEFLYGISNSGKIYQHNLRSPNQRTEIGTTPNPGPIAADGEAVWHIDGRGGVIYRISLDSHESKATAAQLPICRGYWLCQGPGQYRPPSVLVSAGGMLYTAVRSTYEPYGFTNLISIDKYSSAVHEVAGTEASGHRDGGSVWANFSSILGLAVSGEDLLIFDQSTTTTLLRKANDPFAAIDAVVTHNTERASTQETQNGNAGSRSIDIGGPELPIPPRPSASDLWQNYFAYPEGLPPLENPFQYSTEDDWIAINSNHLGKTPLAWKPGTPDSVTLTLNGFKIHRADNISCLTNCELVYWLAEELQKAEGASFTWWDQMEANWSRRTVTDFARDIMLLLVDTQIVYDRDGNLRNSYAAAIISINCETEATDKNVDCKTEDMIAAAEDVKDWADLAAEIVTVFYTIKGGRKPKLKTEHLRVWSHLQNLTQQACKAITRPPGMSAQTWGRLVHVEFEKLVRQSRLTNPKIFGETGYGGPSLTSVPGPGHLPGYRYPDAVYGATADTPEILFDVKTGLKLLERGWLHDVGTKLPAGYSNVRVIALVC